MVKKLSLKEFYENHGNTKPLTSCLPTKPGDVPRDADQGQDSHHRLADLSVDLTSKPYCSDEISFGGNLRHAIPRNERRYYGSGSDVHVSSGSGDVDYYGSSGSYSRYPYGGPPPPKFHSSGSYAPPPPPPAGGPGHVGSAAHPATGTAAPGPAAMGSSGSFERCNHSSYAAPPLPPAPPAGAGRALYAGNTCYPGPPAGDADEDVWYPPPPPPPPRSCPSPSSQTPGAQHDHSRIRTSALVDGPVPSSRPASMANSYTGPALSDRAIIAPPPPHAARKQETAGSATPSPIAALPLVEEYANGKVPAAEAAVPVALATVDVAKPVVENQEADQATAAPSDKAATTPFASAAPTAPAGPKNEFAERLAARAMSHATRAKSNLLAGSVSSSLTSALSGAGSDALVEDSNEQASGPFVKPSHPFGRPRLVLKPRTAPVADAAPSYTGGNTSSASSDSGIEVADHGSSGSVASSVGRPRLQLQPRTLPVATESAANGADTGAAESGRPRLKLLPRGSSNASVADTDSAARKTSVFGAAKPKDLPDPVLLDAAAPRTGSAAHSRLSEAVVARLGNDSPRNGSHWGAGSNVSGDREDEWQMAGRGRKGGSKLNDSSSALLPDDDPFFGTSSRSSFVPVPAARAFDRDIMRNGRGYKSNGSYGDNGYNDSYGNKKYGSPAGSGWGGRYIAAADDAEADCDGNVFRRALPTRHAPLAL